MKANRQETIILHLMSLAGAPSETIAVFRKACTHGSWINEQSPQTGSFNVDESNERLEFLGDSVLGLVVADALYRRLPDADEGVLSKAKARLVSTLTLVRLAKQLDIGGALLLGRGEETSGGRKRESLLADTLEAIIGAVFFTVGFEKAKLFILKIWDEVLAEEVGGSHSKDFKSMLQEYSQNLINELPVYKVLKTIGPDHDRQYTMAVYVRKREVGRGCGKSKKAAEQLAAAVAYKKMKSESSESGEAP